MTIFSAQFNNIGVTTQLDLFDIVAPSNSRVVIRQLEIGQYTDFGDLQDELLSLLLIRGYTNGSSGTPATPVNFDPYGRASTANVRVNNGTLANSGTPEFVYATAFNIRAGYFWQPLIDPRRDRQGDRELVLKPSQRFVVRLNSVPTDSITMNGTLVFEEIGTGNIAG